MSGANTIYGAGMVELGQTFSMEQLVIDNEIIGMNFKVMEGVPVTDETLGVEAIKEIGVGRDFIGHPSTMANFENASNPTLLDRSMLGEWIAAGSTSATERAHEVVKDVLANHKVEPLPEDVMKNIKKILKKADADFVKRREGGE